MKRYFIFVLLLALIPESVFGYAVQLPLSTVDQGYVELWQGIADSPYTAKLEELKKIFSRSQIAQLNATYQRLRAVRPPTVAAVLSESKLTTPDESASILMICVYVFSALVAAGPLADEVDLKEKIKKKWKSVRGKCSGPDADRILDKFLPVGASAKDRVALIFNR